MGEEKNKNIQVEIKNKLCSIKLFIIILSFISLSSGIYAQNPTDSLKTNNPDKPIKEITHSKDSTLEYTSIENIFPGNDTLVNDKIKKNPVRAGLFSAIIPGLGQAYNGKYWKIPIIYSIFAGMYFLTEDNNYKYQLFKDAYKNFETDKPSWIPSYMEKTDVKEYKDYYKRNRDLNIIIFVGLYLMNILDASVDAHLMDYDISDDLTLRIRPGCNFQFGDQKKMNNSGFGLKFVLNF